MDVWQNVQACDGILSEMMVVSVNEVGCSMLSTVSSVTTLSTVS